VPGSGETYRMLEGLKANFYAHGVDAVTAARKATAAIYGMVQQQAAMLSFVEAFWIMGAIFLTMLPFLPLLQYSKPSTAPKLVDKGRSVLSRVDLAEDLQLTEKERAEAEEHHLAWH
jgi:hypothetical protein